MINIIKENLANRLLLFKDTSVTLNIPTPMIEKDFWVCFVLSKIFSDVELKQILRFKGGTSLSKGYNIIERFSEDLDIVLDASLIIGDEPIYKQSNSKQRAFLDMVDEKSAIYISTTLKSKIEKALLDTNLKVYTDEEYVQINPQYKPKKIDNKSLHVVYEHSSTEEYLRPDILLEIGIMSARTPWENKEILPYIATAFPELRISPIVVPIVMPKRTFWDKATILHREHYRPTTTITPERYSRHYYDLYKLAHTNIKKQALDDQELLQDVVERKDRLYHCPWARYEDCLMKNFRLLPNEQSKIQISQDYKAMQKMIYGDKPNWNDILEYLAELEKEINSL